MELSKMVYPWEQNFIKSFSYFVHKYLVKIPCLERTTEEKNTERWYSFLEHDGFRAEVKLHISKLYKLFVKYKVKDLKVSECISINDFIKMTKDLEVIPVFLSTKDIINVKIYF